jgi:hypothetical protein
MSLEKNIANAFANALGPIAENISGSIAKNVTGAAKDIIDDIKRDLSGKQIKIEATITLPDLTK